MKAENLPCSMSVLLYTIYKFHSDTKRTYKFSPDASNYYNQIYDKNKIQISQVNNTHSDIFLG